MGILKFTSNQVGSGWARGTSAAAKWRMVRKYFSKSLNKMPRRQL